MKATMKAADHRSQITRIVSEWYALNPDIRQLRVYEETDLRGAQDIHVVVALRPVCDSDEASPIWLAKCNGWQEQLQALIGRSVHLDWFDGGSDVPPCPEGTGYAGVCLASIAWRDCGTASLSSDTWPTPSSNRPGARGLV